MSRIENWDVWLVEMAEAARNEGFEWGRTDCASLARKCLTQMLGEDPWADDLGTWKSKTAAIKQLAAVGDVESFMVRTGGVEVTERFATTGDIAVGPGQDGNGLIQVAVILPNRKALASSSSEGPKIEPASFVDGTRFWRYGN